MSEPKKTLVHYEAFWPGGGSTKFARYEPEGTDLMEMCIQYMTHVPLNKITATVDGKVVASGVHIKPQTKEKLCPTT